MQSGQEYDYCYEVDGEIRYDFDCEFNSVEIVDVASGKGAASLSEGQIIIANSIQIEHEDTTSMSTASSCSSSSFANDDNEWQNGPVVIWPEYLTKMMPDPALVSMKPGKEFTGDLVLSTSASTTSLDSYCGSVNNTNLTTTTNWSQIQQQQQQQHQHHHHKVVVVVKRVTFWDTKAMAAATAAAASAVARF